MSRLLRATLGLAVWALAFALLYAAHGVGCHGGWAAAAGLMGASLHRSVLAALWLAALAAQALVLWADWRGWRECRETPGAPPAASGTARLLRHAALASAATGALAMLLTGAPVLLASSCL